MELQIIKAHLLVGAGLGYQSVARYTWQGTFHSSQGDWRKGWASSSWEWVEPWNQLIAVERAMWAGRDLFSTPVRWGLLDFMSASRLCLRLLLLLLVRRTSTASSWSQWSLPDPKSNLRIKVSHAGPQLQARDRSGPRRTRTATSGSKWSPPDLNCKR